MVERTEHNIVDLSGTNFNINALKDITNNITVLKMNNMSLSDKELKEIAAFIEKTEWKLDGIQLSSNKISDKS